jgi:hypothetical protein
MRRNSGCFCGVRVSQIERRKWFAVFASPLVEPNYWRWVLAGHKCAEIIGHWAGRFTGAAGVKGRRKDVSWETLFSILKRATHLVFALWRLPGRTKNWKTRRFLRFPACAPNKFTCELMNRKCVGGRG